MPFSIVKAGRKFQVIKTSTGEPLSKEPISKAMAEKQLIAVNIAESKKKRAKAYHPVQLNLTDTHRKRLVTGAGIRIDESHLCEDDKTGHLYHLTKPQMTKLKRNLLGRTYTTLKMDPEQIERNGVEGSGLFDWIKKGVDAVKGVVSNVKDRIGVVLNGRVKGTPAFRKYVETNGNKIIKKIVLTRKKIDKILDVAINALSFGQFAKNKKEAGIENAFHLGMYMTFDDGSTITLEKKSAPEFSSGGLAGLETYDLPPMRTQCSLLTFVDNFSSLGNEIWQYSASKNNCQKFVDDCLESNQSYVDYPEAAQKFVRQDAELLLKDAGVAKAAGTFLPQLQDRFNAIISGAALKRRRRLVRDI